MCHFFSCIVTREGVVYHNAAKNDSHESIIQAHALRDTSADRDELEFCRVEITPPDDRWDLPLSEWQLRIDEQVMPTWWDDGYALFVRDALREFASERIVDAGKHSFESGRVWASGSASVKASGSALVKASGLASVKAWDLASVRASGSASVEAWGSALVEASGLASVKASGSASVEAWDSASVEASGSASVILHNDAVCRRADTFYLSKESKLKFKRVTRVKA